MEFGTTQFAALIGNRIKRARENARITQEDLAKMLEVTPQHVSAIERGSKTPRLSTFVHIANILGVSADTLLCDVVEHSSSNDEDMCDWANRLFRGGHLRIQLVEKPEETTPSTDQGITSKIFDLFTK